MKAVEIYGLFDAVGELRYVGKAKDSAKRLKAHLRESRTCNRPVNSWIKSLLADGKLPHMQVLETVPAEEWQAAEIRLIALYRMSSKLLNVADGGAMPSQTVEQRKAAGRASQRVIKKVDPRIRNLWNAKACVGRLLASCRKDGDTERVEYWRAYMRNKAATNPKWFGDWANV